MLNYDNSEIITYIPIGLIDFLKHYKSIECPVEIHLPNNTNWYDEYDTGINPVLSKIDEIRLHTYDLFNPFLNKLASVSGAVDITFHLHNFRFSNFYEKIMELLHWGSTLYLENDPPLNAVTGKPFPMSNIGKIFTILHDMQSYVIRSRQLGVCIDFVHLAKTYQYKHGNHALGYATVKRELKRIKEKFNVENIPLHFHISGIDPMVPADSHFVGLRESKIPLDFIVSTAKSFEPEFLTFTLETDPNKVAADYAFWFGEMLGYDNYDAYVDCRTKYGGDRHD